MGISKKERRKLKEYLKDQIEKIMGDKWDKESSHWIKFPNKIYGNEYVIFGGRYIQNLGAISRDLDTLKRYGINTTVEERNNHLNQSEINRAIDRSSESKLNIEEIKSDNGIDVQIKIRAQRL